MTDRHEIAQAMNFGRYPVLHINMETPLKGYEGYFHGDKVVVLDPRPNYPDHQERGNLYFCEGSFEVSSHGACLHADFGYHDVMEMLEWAQAPHISAGQTVVIVCDYPEARKCSVRMMKVSAVRSFTTPCCELMELEDKDEK